MNDRSDEDDALAAEYVLGVLPLPERIKADQRINQDAGFALLVQGWQNRLSDLNDDYAPVPAPDLLPRIEGRLFPVAPKRRFGWAGWGLGAALAAGVAILAYLPLTAPDAGRDLGADLVATAGDVRLNAVYSAKDGTLTVTRVLGPDAPAGHTHELWLISGENPPRPLGLMENAAVVLTMAAPVAGDVLAISLEPTGGSPTGLPTGPVLATGAITEL